MLSTVVKREKSSANMWRVLTFESIIDIDSDQRTILMNRRSVTQGINGS